MFHITPTTEVNMAYDDDNISDEYGVPAPSKDVDYSDCYACRYTNEGCLSHRGY